MLKSSAGWNTDTCRERDVSDGDATASRDGFEDCKLAPQSMRRSLGPDRMRVAALRLTHLGDQFENLPRGSH